MGKPAIWVTGASSGIGKSIALKFIDSQKNVIVSSRNEKELNNYLAKESDLIKVFPVDVTDAENVKSTFTNISDEYDIDCLINNAGVTSFTPVENSTEEDLTKIINTNLSGAIRLIQQVLPGMIERKHGTIINILSVAADVVFKNSAIYSASKAGLKAFAKVLREEVRKHNIRVINIYPGATRTPIWPNNALEEFGERMMSPDDIANLIYELYQNNSTAIAEEIVLRPIQGDLK
ncbi:MAG: SDR family oxidoreductase [Ignavibacteria bacterium]|nr:MAG: SDR family oxidoreductase [Ignavibacteria bacterium]